MVRLCLSLQADPPAVQWENKKKKKKKEIPNCFPRVAVPICILTRNE